MFRSYPDRILRDARGVPKVMSGVLLPNFPRIRNPFTGLNIQATT